LVSRVNQLEAEFREKIEDIKVQTSRRSEDQDETIAIIKVKQRNSAQLLNQNKEDLQVLKMQNKEQAKRIDLLEKKLAAMLQNTPPPSELNQMKNARASKAALTPPSSCQDLSNLDYFLDGLYLVKNKQTKKIQTVFCQFTAPNKSIGHKTFLKY